jgi:hypothetical protein
MTALTVCVARPAGAGRASASPASQPSRPAFRAHALSIPAPQPSLGSSSYSTGPGAQLEAAAPSCPWPQQKQAAAQGRGIFAWLQGNHQQPAAAEAALPPEVERLMRFSDAPLDAEQQQEEGWLRFWRYQGP